MPTKVVIFEEPDKILRSIGPFQQINFVKVPNVSRSKEVAGYTYTTYGDIRYISYCTFTTPFYRKKECVSKPQSYIVI
jgi:hypothetical protein